MGYRSDVRIITSKKGYDELKKFNDEYLDKNKNINGFKEYSLLDNLTFKAETDNSVYIGWEWVKWYEGYNSVDAIMEGLNHLENNNYSYRYARIGENISDIEEYTFNGTLEGEKDIHYLEISRGFDDSNVFEKMNNEIDKKSKQVDSKSKKDNLER